MAKKHTPILISTDLLAEIDRLVGKRGRSRFLTEAALHEVKRLQQLRALKAAAGAWKDKDHPELKAGAAAWVRKLREQDEKRFRRLMKG